MMTYLKHVGGKKHADLKNKNFEEIQVLYEKIKMYNDKFITGLDKDDSIKKDDSVKEKVKEEEETRKRKLGTRKKIKSKKRKLTSKSGETASDTAKDDDELRLCLIIASDEDKEVDYEILDKKYPIIEWKSEYLATKPQYDESKGLEEVNLNVVFRSNGQIIYSSTLMRVLSIFDREDLNAVYQLVMNRYLNDIPEGFNRILWGDLMIMFNQSDADEFWSTQQDWKVVCWKLHNSSGVHTLLTETGLVIHMLVKNKYPMKKDVMSQMLEIKLESEEDSTMALELIRPKTLLKLNRLSSARRSKKRRAVYANHKQYGTQYVESSDEGMYSHIIVVSPLSWKRTIRCGNGDQDTHRDDSEGLCGNPSMCFYLTKFKLRTASLFDTTVSKSVDS
ncbi:hypothetical protein Tco_0296548 [Tanacetum coccineum]